MEFRRRMFQIIDDDSSRKLEFSEFKKGVADYGLTLTENEAKALFASLDTDGSGFVDYEEFLLALRVKNLIFKNKPQTQPRTSLFTHQTDLCNTLHTISL